MTAPAKAKKSRRRRKPRAAAATGPGAAPSLAQPVGQLAVPAIPGLAKPKAKASGPVASEPAPAEVAATKPVTATPQAEPEPEPDAGPESETLEAEDEAVDPQTGIPLVEKLSAEQRVALLTTWGITDAANDSRAKFIFANQESLDYFWNLPDEHKAVMSGQGIKKRRQLTQAEFEKAKAARETVLAEAAEALRKKQEAEQAQAAHDARKQDFAEYRTQLKAEITKRLEALEMTDFVWAEEFEKSADQRAGSLKNAATNLVSTKNNFGKDWNSKVDKEKKRRDVEEAAKKADYALLAKTKLNEIKDEVLKDNKATAADFDSRAVEALAQQRNPADLDTWIRWLDLELYPKYENLEPQLGYAVHFTLDRDALSLPPIITADTKAADLIDDIMKAPKNQKMYQAHVSLETGVRSSDGAYKNPHLYWRGADRYEMRFTDGPDRPYRWDTDRHTQEEVAGALDSAMAEIRATLVARLKKVLDKAGNL